MLAFTYPYQVATLIALICTEIFPSINLPIHCNHMADSGEMKLETPCTPRRPNTGPVPFLSGGFSSITWRRPRHSLFPQFLLKRLLRKAYSPATEEENPESGGPSTRPPELPSPWGRSSPNDTRIQSKALAYLSCYSRSSAMFSEPCVCPSCWCLSGCIEEAAEHLRTGETHCREDKKSTKALLGLLPLPFEGNLAAGFSTPAAPHAQLP